MYNLLIIVPLHTNWFLIVRAKLVIQWAKKPHLLKNLTPLYLRRIKRIFGKINLFNVNSFFLKRVCRVLWSNRQICIYNVSSEKAIIPQSWTNSPPIKLHSPPLTPPLQGRGVYLPKSGSVLSKVWKRSFQSLDALLLKSGRVVSIVWKQTFWWAEAGTGFMHLYWYWQRLQDYRITPYFLNPGFQKTANIYYMFIKLHTITYIYTHIYMCVNKYT